MVHGAESILTLIHRSGDRAGSFPFLVRLHRLDDTQVVARREFLMRYSATWKDITESCKEAEWDPEVLFKKGKLILESYRKVCWKTQARAEDMRNELSDLGTRTLDGALVYLTVFAPEMEKQRFESCISSMFDTRQLIELVRTTLIEVKKYPLHGEEYFRILCYRYIEERRCSERDAMEYLNMGRGTYHDKKKVAILVFAYTLLAVVLPNYKQIFDKVGGPDYREEFYD